MLLTSQITELVPGCDSFAQTGRRREPRDKRIPLLNFGEKAHKAGVFDRNGKLALILGAGAGLRTRGDLSVGRDEPLKEFHIFVVDVFDVVLREVADFATGMHLLESHVFRFLS